MRLEPSARNLSEYFDLSEKPRRHNGRKETVCRFNVDDDCKFKDQTSLRRTQLVQIFEVDTSIWVTFSFLVPQNFNNLTLDWQVEFTESSCWEVRLQLKNEKYPVVQILANDNYSAPVWHRNLRINKWYNFGVFVTVKETIFYMSVGDGPLRYVATDRTAKCDVKKEDFQEHHFGLLSWQPGVHPNIGSTQSILFSDIRASAQIDDSMIRSDEGDHNGDSTQDDGSESESESGGVGRGVQNGRGHKSNGNADGSLPSGCGQNGN
uniref:AlNc14C478G11876 protein n=1 Tax=Albugo laibachii Nc14 TaxID=890382 RepID=F0X0D7_9STRA|nr:AlNc14C478G11876 [Albugo laibachii Nc14]|eukprot:CCA27222.1 AlNc14C478G11876 [Albugo laibachii Nc14]